MFAVFILWWQESRWVRRASHRSWRKLTTAERRQKTQLKTCWSDWTAAAALGLLWRDVAFSRGRVCRLTATPGVVFIYIHVFIYTFSTLNRCCQWNVCEWRLCVILWCECCWDSVWYSGPAVAHDNNTQSPHSALCWVNVQRFSFRTNICPITCLSLSIQSWDAWESTISFSLITSSVLKAMLELNHVLWGSMTWNFLGWHQQS